MKLQDLKVDETVKIIKSLNLLIASLPTRKSKQRTRQYLSTTVSSCLVSFDDFLFQISPHLEYRSWKYKAVPTANVRTKLELYDRRDLEQLGIANKRDNMRTRLSVSIVVEVDLIVPFFFYRPSFSQSF